MRLDQYEAFLVELSTELQRYLVSRGARPETAADICQDVFVKALEMDLALPPDKLRGYLYRVAWSTYLDHYRRERRYRELVAQYLVPNQREQVNQQTTGQLAFPFQKLRPKERDLLILRYDQGLSIKEIAMRLGRRPGAVKMRLRRVHQKLKRLMGSEWHE